MYSTDCDLSINDLWSTFQEELTSGIKRFIPHRLNYKLKKISVIGTLTIPLTVSHLCYPCQLQLLVSLSYYRQPKATQGRWA